MKITVIGSIFVDIKGYPKGEYIPWGRNAGNIQQVYGGVGRNVAEDINNAGLRTNFLSLVDNSGIGEAAAEYLKSRGINTEYIRRVQDGMGTWLAVFDHRGDVVASISKRPDMKALDFVLEEHGDEIFKSSDSVVLQLDMEESTCEKVFSLAEKHGKDVYAVISNMSIVMERRDYLGLLACLVCNRQEAAMLSGDDYKEKSVNEMIDAAKNMVNQFGLRRIVITLGEEGAVYAGKGGISGFCLSHSVKVVDTTGAGDAFLAGVAVGLTMGKSLAEACETGSLMAESVICSEKNVYTGQRIDGGEYE